MNPTGTEARVCADIAARQAKGTAKYGTTVQDNPLGLIQWLQHAYEECLDQAVYLKRAIEQLQGVGPIPSNSAELEDPHAELRKTWRKGQLWDWFDEEMGIWNECDPALGPDWNPKTRYRRHPEDKDPEPAPPADPHAALKAIYRPGMRWRIKYEDETCSAWFVEVEDYCRPKFSPTVVYEIHPDDLPESPDTDGWITVPDDLMEMPEGLGNMDRVDVRTNSGVILKNLRAGGFAWRVTAADPYRIKAYRLIKPAE